MAAQAAIQPSLSPFDVSLAHLCSNVSWVPAFAGMTSNWSSLCGH
jgi:hypothetical protein